MLAKFWRQKITRPNVTREICFHTKNARVNVDEIDTWLQKNLELALRLKIFTHGPDNGHNASDGRVDGGADA